MSRKKRKFSGGRPRSIDREAPGVVVSVRLAADIIKILDMMCEEEKRQGTDVNRSEMVRRFVKTGIEVFVRMMRDE